MEFNRIFNIFTVSAIAIMILITAVSACFTISNRANGNLGVGLVAENEKNDQLTDTRF